MYEYVACIYVFEPHGYSGHRGQKRTLNPPEIRDTGGLEMVQVIQETPTDNNEKNSVYLLGGLYHWVAQAYFSYVVTNVV